MVYEIDMRMFKLIKLGIQMERVLKELSLKSKIPNSIQLAPFKTPS